MKLTEKHVTQGLHRADGDLTALTEHLNLVLKRSDKDLVRENRRLRCQLARLEGLRPHWAQGFTDASVAAQVKTAELVRVTAERDALQALLNERDEKLARYAEFLAWCESAPVGSGVCCCGDNMEGHGHYADQGAVDEWDHSLGNWAKELRK